MNELMKNDKKATVLKWVLLIVPFLAYFAHIVSAYKLNEENLAGTAFVYVGENLELFNFSYFAASLAILLVSINAVYRTTTGKVVKTELKKISKLSINKNSIFGRTIFIPVIIIITLIMLTGAGVGYVIYETPNNLTIYKKAYLLMSPYMSIAAISFFALMAILFASQGENDNGNERAGNASKSLNYLKRFPITLGAVNALILLILWVFPATTISSLLALKPDNWANWQLITFIILGSFTALTNAHDKYFKKTLIAMSLMVISSKLNLSWVFLSITNKDIATPTAFLSDGHLAYLALGHLSAFIALGISLLWIYKAFNEAGDSYLPSWTQIMLSGVVILLQYSISVNSMRHLALTPFIESSSIEIKTTEIDQIVFDTSKFQFKKIYQSNYKEAASINDAEFVEMIAEYLSDKGYVINKDSIADRESLLGFSDILVLYKNLIHDDVRYLRSHKVGGEHDNYKYLYSFIMTGVAYHLIDAEDDTLFKALPLLNAAIKSTSPIGRWGESYDDAHSYVANMLYALEKKDKEQFWDIYSSNPKLIEAASEISKIAYRVSLIRGWEPPKGVAIKMKSTSNKGIVKIGNVDVPRVVYNSARAEANAHRLIKYGTKLKKVIEEDAKKSGYCGLNPFDCKR